MLRKDVFLLVILCRHGEYPEKRCLLLELQGLLVEQGRNLRGPVIIRDIECGMVVVVFQPYIAFRHGQAQHGKITRSHPMQRGQPEHAHPYPRTPPTSRDNKPHDHWESRL